MRARSSMKSWPRPWRLRHSPPPSFLNGDFPMKTSALYLMMAVTGSAMAAPVTYNVEPNHTFPAFETDHLGGLSIIRGKFDKTSGTVVLDKEAGTGTVDITIDTSSIDLGHEKLETHVKTAEMLNVAKYPTASYKG